MWRRGARPAMTGGSNLPACVSAPERWRSRRFPAILTVPKRREGREEQGGRNRAGSPGVAGRVKTAKQKEKKVEGKESDRQSHFTAAPNFLSPSSAHLPLGRN